MKKMIFLCALVVALAGSTFAQESRNATLQAFTADFMNYNDQQLDNASPIASFNKMAEAQAKKTIVLTKENIAAALTEAKDYDHCVITVGIHTLVRVTDPANTSPSGAWGTTVPYGKGYILKEGLTAKEGYINNIIGIPDQQERKLFLF